MSNTIKKALKFKPENREQLHLLPPSLNDYVSENHLVRLIESNVNEVDCSFIEDKYSEFGQKSYSPALLLKLWVYSYCIGIYLGRKIASKFETDTAIINICGYFLNNLLLFFSVICESVAISSSHSLPNSITQSSTYRQHLLLI